MSFSYQPKDEQRQGQKQQRNAPPAEDMDQLPDDIPF